MQISPNPVTYSAASTPTKITVTPASDSAEGFFSPGGPSWHDVVDAINPLEHIPIVAGLYDQAMDHAPSTVARLAGGALLGGPIGFVASLASVIFESATGQGFGEAVVAALSGDSASETTQFASNETTETAEEIPTQNASLETATPDATALTPITTAALNAPLQQLAEASKPLPTDGTVLDLYGASTKSAHRSYQKAQMLNYLQDVTTTHVS